MAIASGLLLAVTFPPSSLGWLILFAFLPLFSALKKSPAPKNSFWLGTISGIIYFGWGLRWFFTAVPLDWAGIDGLLLGRFLIFAVWAVTVFSLAVFWGLFTYGAKRFFFQNNLAFFWLVPLFTVTEYLRSWGPALLWAGKEAAVGGYWTFISPAYALAAFPKWRFLSSIGGIYLLDFFIIFINCALFFLLQRNFKKNKTYLFLAVFLSLLAINTAPYLFAQNNGWGQTVFALQTKIPSSLRETPESSTANFVQQSLLLEKIAQENFQQAAIFMPEDSRFLRNYPLAAKIVLQKNFADKNVLLVDSSRTQTEKNALDLISFYDLSQQKILAQSPKIFLMPGGEYLPYLVKLTAVLFGQKDFIGNFDSSRQYFSGPALKIASWQNINLGGELCSAVMAPSIYQQATARGATVLFNLASHSIFKGSPVLEAQTLAMAQIRAAENNRYFIQTTNFGSSFILDNRGSIVQKSTDLKTTYLRAEARMIKNKSLYSLTGDFVPLVCVLLLIARGCCFLKRKGGRQPQNKSFFPPFFG